MHVKSVQMCLTLWPPWNVNCQAPLSVGFSRQEYCSGLPCPPPGDLPNLRTEPLFLRSPALAGRFFNRHHLGRPLLRIKWSRSLVSGRIVTYQTPPSMGFSRQEYWSGLPFPSPGDHPNPGIEPGSPALQADVLTSEPPGKPSFGLSI